MKDRAPLAASNRLRTRYDIGTKQVLLQITDARPQDVGEYLVIATNPAGEDSTVATLTVSPDKKTIDDRPFVPTEKFRNLEHPEGTGKRPLEIIPGVDVQPFISPEKFRKLNEIPSGTKPEQEVPEPKRPPRVIQPLTDVALEELMPVIFSTVIDAGSPMASVITVYSYSSIYFQPFPFLSSLPGSKMVNHYSKAIDSQLNMTFSPRLLLCKFWLHVLMIKAFTLYVQRIHRAVMKQPAIFEFNKHHRSIHDHLYNQNILHH